jgi:hypothetical protein
MGKLHMLRMSILGMSCLLVAWSCANAPDSSPPRALEDAAAASRRASAGAERDAPGDPAVPEDVIKRADGAVTSESSGNTR